MSEENEQLIRRAYALMNSGDNVRAIAAPIRAMIEQHAGEAQEEAWDAITQAAAKMGGGTTPLSFSNAVLLASATA